MRQGAFNELRTRGSWHAQPPKGNRLGTRNGWHQRHGMPRLLRKQTLTSISCTFTFSYQKTRSERSAVAQTNPGKTEPCGGGLTAPRQAARVMQCPVMHEAGKRRQYA